MKLLGISAEEKINFSRGLALMLKSGISIVTALDLLSEQSRSGDLRRIIKKARASVSKGHPLHKTFEENREFRGVFSSFIKLGEKTGTLEENLGFLSEWLEKDNDLRESISSATLYPKIVITVAILLIGGITMFILPRLVPMFEVLDIDLPATTRILLSFSKTMQNYGFYIFGAVIAFFIIFKLSLRVKRIKEVFDFLLLRMPLFGSLVSDYQRAFFLQVFHILIRSGMPIKQGIDIASESLSNIVYQKSVLSVGRGIRGGNPVSKELERYPGLYPGILRSVIASGEATGNLEESTKYLSDFYAKKIKKRVEDIPTVIEPTLLLVIGLFVALLASAIILPIYEITRGLNI